MKITKVEITVVEIPQIPPIAPYRSHIRTSSVTQSAIVRLDTDEGLVGWGEYNCNFIPVEEFVKGRKAASEMLEGWDPWNLEKYHAECTFEPRLRSGLEMAMWDLCGQAAGVPVAALWGGIIRPEVELAACMGIQSYERAREIASL